MDCWIYRDGATESTSITGGSLINLVREGRLSRFSEIRSAAGGEWQTVESSEFKEFLPGEQSVPVAPPVHQAGRFGCAGVFFVVTGLLLAILLLAASGSGHGGSGGLLIVVIALLLFGSIGGWVLWVLLLGLGGVIAVQSLKRLSEASASHGGAGKDTLEGKPKRWPTGFIIVGVLAALIVVLTVFSSTHAVR